MLGVGVVEGAPPNRSKTSGKARAGTGGSGLEALPKRSLR